MRIVYLIKHSVTNDLYIGQTSNMKRRLAEHNSGKTFSTRTKENGFWLLVYAEAYLDETDAKEREHKLKHHGNAKQGLYKRISRSLGNQK